MIDRILMELYDDYSSGNNQTLIDFTKKTFPNDGTDNFFIGCVLILFSRANGFKPRYDCTREKLLSIVLSAKEKIGSSNLLAFYIDRINDKTLSTSYIVKYSDLVKKLKALGYDVHMETFDERINSLINFRNDVAKTTIDFTRKRTR